ncbi:hypothetical protein SPLC1_S206990 [Arthrospira platensis C1]|uniref:Tc1-like transposase DDE domain-containing protein n=2 Tax=Limnospira TaxID=2596745 RepID=A0A9P1P0L3_9CYAN|nr:ISSoc4, transposase orfB [Limnospira maxima CS-328]EKD09297.1 hypothetical protein SPLC1_S206990 [Arthrospira platensis C1]UWU46276.1 DDE superfamily endonuclease [Arthrospira platensis C1]CDM97548.1 conserved protein of unknown function [Limnospira indica PCC 8005]
MSRALARATKGKKVYELRKSYRGQKMTIIGAIKLSGVVATQTLEGSMKKEDFLQLIKLDLLPKLKKGDVVVMDN